MSVMNGYAHCPIYAQNKKRIREEQARALRDVKREIQAVIDAAARADKSATRKVATRFQVTPGELLEALNSAPPLGDTV